MGSLLITILDERADISISWQILDIFIGYACAFIMELSSGSDKIDPESLVTAFRIIVVDNCTILTPWKLGVVNHTACFLGITSKPVWFLGPQDNLVTSAALKQVGMNSIFRREYARNWEELENGWFPFRISSRESKGQDSREERNELHDDWRKKSMLLVIAFFYSSL